VPQAERQEPLHLQISGFYKREILEGRLRPGMRLPSIRAIRDEWDVGQNSAQRAVEHLRTEGLVVTRQDGTFVAAPRAALGPQQRIRLAAPPASEITEVLSAEIVRAPEYIVPILDLNGLVIRREEVTRHSDGTPHRLSVTWCAPWQTAAAPELEIAQPLPDPRGAAHLIAARTGRAVEWGRQGIECRLAREDGRERLHLGLEQGAYVLAGVYTWMSGDDVLEYTEYVLPPGQVIESDLEP